MRILLTGANGQLGRCLQDRVSRDIALLACDARLLDITNRDAVVEFFFKEQPNFIVNAAAYTAVDKAESEYDLANKVNHLGVENLALAAREINIPLIHISTDYVFDGTAKEAYKTDAPTCPKSLYGRTKLAGEEVLRNSYDNHIIIRTAWVFSEYGNNFVKTILRLAKERDEINIVVDQQGCPTYAGDLAIAILTIIKQVQEGNTSRGTFHYCGSKPTTWHGFASAIIEQAYLQEINTRKTRVKPIQTEEYPLPAPRPAFSVLNCQTTQDTWQISQPSWQAALRHVLEDIKLGNNHI